VLSSCAWLTRFDLDLLAFLLAATYSSVLVCLSLVQSNLEGYPGLSALPSSRPTLLVSDGLVFLAFSTTLVNSEGDAAFLGLFNDFGQGEGDWLEQVIGVFHLFFYRTATFEAVLLNLFLLLALVASLAVLTSLGSNFGGAAHAAVRGAYRVRLVRSFRRQIRRKNSSQVRSARG
jgi:hypothetical protein